MKTNETKIRGYFLKKRTQKKLMIVRLNNSRETNSTFDY